MLLLPLLLLLLLLLLHLMQLDAASVAASDDVELRVKYSLASAARWLPHLTVCCGEKKARLVGGVLMRRSMIGPRLTCHAQADAPAWPEAGNTDKNAFPVPATAVQMCGSDSHM